MFTSETFTQDMLSNPTRLTNAVIDAMEATDTSDPVSINDPNNGVVMQLMANTFMFAELSKKIDYTNEYYYPQRSRTAEQLYTQLSEFDYVNLMAAPATLPFVMELSRDWIIANAVYFDTNYNKITIPASSRIVMGGNTYSMYYPIDILVNRNTQAVTAFYNSSPTNTLSSLASNMLIDVAEYKRDGINWFRIIFNMYQFTRTQTDYPVSAQEGFIRTIPYDDQFYAAKVYTLQSDGTWKELAYSLQQRYYDYQTPTALLSVLSDKSALKIEIPRIYFQNQQISQTVRVKLYTTKGAVNYTVSPGDVQGLTSHFDTGSTPFAAPLEQAPIWNIVPTTTEVSGGRDAMDYAEMREAIVNQRLYSRVAITPPELIEAGRKAGFGIIRTIDDLTERMYYATNTLVDSNALMIPTFTGGILLRNAALEGNPSSIINHPDGYVAVLPTTLFRISNSNQTCEPLSDGEVAALAALSPQEFADELNTGRYMRQPFHIMLRTAAKSPSARVYSLLAPKMTSLVFGKENAHSGPQLSVAGARVEHLADGTGGYRIRITATRSTNIEGVDANNFLLILTCKSKVGTTVYLPTTFVGNDDQGNDVWEVIITTTYRITNDEYMTVMMRDDSGVLGREEIPLEQTFTVVSAFATIYEPTIPVDGTLNVLLPSIYSQVYTVMSSSQMKIAFGSNLSQQVYCGVSTSWGNDVYDVADETIYHTTRDPIFQRNEQGLIETRPAQGTGLDVVLIYAAGSTPSATGDFSARVTQRAFASPNPGVLQISDTTGILPGMRVRGATLPVDVTVTSKTTTAITLSAPLEVTMEVDTQLTFTNPNPNLRTTEAQSDVGDELVVADTTGILEGQNVFGFGLDADTKVAGILNSSTIMIDKPTLSAVAEGTLLSFYNQTVRGVVKTEKGEILLDPTGKPVIVKAAQNQYTIPAILFDGRLFASEDVSDQDVVKTISQRLQNYANQIATIDPEFLEDADVYYKPTRTMGTAVFGVGNNETRTLNLALGFSFTVYVDEAIYNTETVLDNMRASIVRTVNQEIQNPTISVSDITETIRQNLGVNVSGVEGHGINGDPTLRFMALEEPGASPSIENVMVVQTDGTVVRTPNILITFLPKPDTVDEMATTRL